MSLPHKNLLIVLLILLPISSSLCIDMYLPAYADIARAFAVREGDINLSMGLYLAGLAIGQLFYGPLADRFGRRKTLILGLSIFIVASFACALSRTLEVFLLARFFQALGACSCIVISRAMVADIFTPQQRGTLLALISAANIFSPALAPLLGGYFVHWFGWVAIFKTITVAGVVMLAATVLLVPETLLVPDKQALQFKRMKYNLQRLLSYRVFIGYMVGIALLYALAFIWVTYSPAILMNEFQITPEKFGLFFLVPAMGSTSGALLTAMRGNWLSEERFIGLGYIVVLTAVIMLFSLIASNHFTSPLMVVIPIMLIFFGINMVQPLQVAGALAPFTDMAGFTSGMIGFIQISAGACITLVTSAFYDAGFSTMVMMMLSTTLLALYGFYFAMRSRLTLDNSRSA